MAATSDLPPAFDRLIEKLNKAQPKQCFIGFDAFTDEILDVVETRRGSADYVAMTQIKTLGETILAAAGGKSCNIEVVTRKQKIGGNGPILANAMVGWNHQLTFAGPIGTGHTIEPLFQEFAGKCHQVLSLGSSGSTQALEFQDGKVMIGKHASILAITWEALLHEIPLPQLTTLLDKSDLFVSANWTMLPGTTKIWEEIAKQIAPRLSDKDRWMFVDLADPAKRTVEDIQRGMAALKTLNGTFAVVLGVNEAEARQVASALGIAAGDDLAQLAQDLHANLGITQVVLHAAAHAWVVTPKGSATATVPLATKPKLMTGAGDNFNAGFCQALLLDADPLETLLCGIGTSSFYVRNARSPNLKELASFLDLWKNGKIDHQ